jgi:Cu2+-containing amine oxidase
VRSIPSEPNRSSDRERRFAEIADYVRNPEPLDGHAVALWTATTLHHIPRIEDFGAKDYNASEGSAIMMWTGFDLMPHNLWSRHRYLQGTDICRELKQTRLAYVEGQVWLWPARGSK